MSQCGEAKNLKGFFRKPAAAVRFMGPNRRAIGLLPEPSEQRGTNMPTDTSTHRQRLLVAVEANQNTCCVKVVSERQKSRAAILVFRGRVLGTIYGSINVREKLFDQEAYQSACNDLIDPEASVAAFAISEPVAIAAAALFHGQFSEPQPLGVAQEAFWQSVKHLVDLDMPGCILVNDGNGVALLSAYVFRGKIVGLYSGQEGWLPADPSVAFKLLATFTDALVTCAVLNAMNLQEVLDLTFSLSGLADRNCDDWSQSMEQIDPSLRIRDKDIIELKGLKKEKTASRLVNSRNNDASLDRELFLRSQMGHLVNP